MTARPKEPTSAKPPTIRVEAMRMMPWPELDQQLSFVAWAVAAMPWGELFAFDAPGALVVLLADDAGAGRDGDLTGAEHRRRCGALDLVRRHEGTWQRMDGRVVELAPELAERFRCDVAPTFDGSPTPPRRCAGGSGRAPTA